MRAEKRDERSPGHWDERSAAHWLQHAPSLTRLRVALDRAAAALAPTEPERARLEAFFGSEAAPEFWGQSPWIAVSPDRVDLAALVQALQELWGAGAALQRPPGCAMDEFKYQCLPDDLPRRYFGIWDQVWAIVGELPASADAEVGRRLARVLTRSDKASLSAVWHVARGGRKAWYVVDPETWRELAVPQRHRWLWWRSQRVIALLCPMDHRRELRGGSALRVLRSIHRAAAADLDCDSASRGFDYTGDVRCPSCGRSYGYEAHFAGWDVPE